MERIDLNTVLHKFISTDRQHRTLLEKQVSKGSLHCSQHRMLLHIYKCSEPPTQKELAQFFEISYAAVAVMLKKLEGAGYVKRAVQENDMRCNRVILTEKGEKILKDTKVLVDQVDSNMFKDFSLEEFASFYKCLEKMQKNLSEFERKDNESMV